MKTTKVILLAAAMAIATVGFSQAESSPVCAEKPSPTIAVKTTVLAAMHNPALLRVLQSELNSSFLKVDRKVYTVSVQLQSTIYYISGTYKDWALFFSIKPMPILQKD